VGVVVIYTENVKELDERESGETEKASGGAGRESK
jgi:hypothetical protein